MFKLSHSADTSPFLSPPFSASSCSSQCMHMLVRTSTLSGSLSLCRFRPTNSIWIRGSWLNSLWARLSDELSVEQDLVTSKLVDSGIELKVARDESEELTEPREMSADVGLI